MNKLIQLTRWLYPNRNMDTIKGYVKNRDWLNQERLRIMEDYRLTEIREKNGKFSLWGEEHPQVTEWNKNIEGL